MTAKPKKVVFAPGVLEQMEKDFTPEELQEVMQEIAKMAAGDEEIESTPVDMKALMLEDPELYNVLVKKLEEVDDIVPPTLQ